MTLPVVSAVHLVGIRRYLKKLRATRNRTSVNAQQYSIQKSAILSMTPQAPTNANDINIT